MNSRQKIVQQKFLNNEEAIIRRLNIVYTQALKDIQSKIQSQYSEIQLLTDAINELEPDDPQVAVLKSMRQSKVYQKQYQEALKKQVSGVLDDLHSKEYKDVNAYLKGCYDDGFVGAMYDLHGQGIPLIIPIDQQRVVHAVQLDSKISHGLYRRLGEDIQRLKAKITAEVSRSMVTGTSYARCAELLAGRTNIGFNNAIRIARTEGHRIQTTAAMDAMTDAAERGADVVKQWDATLDKRTRESHRAVDGQIRELDEPFSNGLRYPGDPMGAASEVIRCRCALLQRARWALDDGELEKLKERAEFYGLDKATEFDDFKEKYLQASELPEVPIPWDKQFPNVQQEIRAAIDKRYAELNSKYHAKITKFQSTYNRDLEEYDIQFQNYCKHLTEQNPRMRKSTIERRAKELLGGRPNSVREWMERYGTLMIGGDMNMETRVMTLNSDGLETGVTFADSVLKRLKFTERQRKRAEKGREALPTGNVGTGLENAFIHEYGHAVDFTYGISKNEKFLEFYRSYSRKEIELGVSAYAATDEREFLAECFAESVFDDQGEISKAFMKLMEEIINDHVK